MVGCPNLIFAIGYWLPIGYPSVIGYRSSNVILVSPLVCPILLADSEQDIQGTWSRRATGIIDQSQSDSSLSGQGRWFQNYDA